MNWEDEPFVKLYTRDTTDWCLWPWQSQALLPLLMRKVDRAGVIDLGTHGTRGLGAHLKAPQEFIEAGLAGLLEDGCVELHGARYLIIRSFKEAQEARQNDRTRQQASRERRRDMARFEVLTGDDVTNRDEVSQNVTERHELSHAVTSGHNLSLLEEKRLEEKREEREAGTPASAGEPPPVLQLVPPERPIAQLAREEASAWVEWFNRKFGREFQVRAELVKDVRALLERKYTQEDMRIVSLFKREEWGDNPKMAGQLVPDVLLRPSKFGGRLDAARQWFRQLQEQETHGR